MSGAAPRLDVAFPFTVDAQGRTARAGYDRHVRDMIELVLFTRPGERVMRPDFGCGLADLVFAPGGPELAASVRIAIEAALQRWLADVIEVTGVEVTGQDGTLRIRVSYTVTATGAERTEVFTGRAEP